MTMTPKDGDLTDWSDYRGITLLSLVGKLFESILAERIFLALEARGRIPAEQGGFRRGFGQSDHIFILSESIKYRARRGRCTYCAFLDIRKAFPTTHRASMLAGLSRAGIGGKVWHISLAQPRYSPSTVNSPSPLFLRHASLRRRERG